MFGKRGGRPALGGQITTPRSLAGVHVSLAELAALEHRSLTGAAPPRRLLESLLTGRHASRMRGRGLDFIELRHYLPGDDVRAIDWRVTARSGRPHVRVYTEERDRPVVLLVDQRQNMFFATRRAMKSVVAAEAAALLGWTMRRGGDRVGALVIGDSDLASFTPHRSRAGWLRVLGEIARRNQALSADETDTTAPGMLDQALAQLLRVLNPGQCILLLSDFHGAGEPTHDLIAQLARRHQLLAMPIRDPGAGLWPERGRYVVSNGPLQLALTGGDAAERQRCAEEGVAHRRRVQRWREELAVPSLPLSTSEDVAAQLRRALAIDPGGQVDGR